MRGHCGAIRVFSELGEGSIIEVLLPVGEASGRPAVEENRQAEGNWQGSGTVLIVDDEQSVRNVARAILVRKGFDVLLAEDGVQAVETFRQRASEIDVVLLDMTMPRLSGEETLREIRGLRSDAKVILSTSYSEQEASSRFAGKGLVGFIQKPFEFLELVNTVRSALETTPRRGEHDDR